MPLFSADSDQQFCPGFTQNTKTSINKAQVRKNVLLQRNISAGKTGPEKKGENTVWFKCVFDVEQISYKDCFPTAFESDTELLFTLFGA